MVKNTSNIPLVGGVVAAIGAGLCCAGPLVLLLLGIGGSWIGTLTLFEPYRAFFIVAVVLLFGVAGWRLFRQPQPCDSELACAVPKVQYRRKVIFWLAALFSLVLVTSNYWLLWVL